MSAAESIRALPGLDAQHAVTPVLAERLLAALREQQLGECPHLPVGHTASTWWPGATERSCLECADVHLRFAGFDIDEGEVVPCEGCGVRDLAQVPGGAHLLPVGQVLVVALLCDQCGSHRMSVEYDLVDAGIQVLVLLPRGAS